MRWELILDCIRDVFIRTFFFIIIGLFWGSFSYMIINIPSMDNLFYWIVTIIVGAFGIAFTGKMLDIVADID
jgi:hypothetical protein